METTGFDLFQFEQLLTDQQRALCGQIRAYVDNIVVPNINPFWERAEYPRDIFMAIKELPIIGGTIKGYGCAGLDSLAYGLVQYELSRGDGSISTIFIVHSSLAMGTIGYLGSDEQRERWLPAMARMEKIGAFGLTEPERGSDASHLLTVARRDGDDYILNGAKRWIGNASFADLLIIWARDEAGGFGGFVLENPTQLPGVTIADIPNKIGKRAVPNAHITLENVRVPAENRLEGCTAFKDITKILTYSRYGVAWEAIGLAAGCFEQALKYTKERQQFDRPIASFQLVQQKLVEMAAEVSHLQFFGYHLAQLMEADELSIGQVALAKYSATTKARRVAQLGREVLGGNGILLDYHVARLFTDAEAIYSYEGTADINLLIAGREITGLNAIV
ncbi:MAG: acyl-CoA dehydrogenase family protein [Anaerolineae bacterium]|nr:acyl-CoA dehydrogenase family protein [Anaerolineae bacterium]MCB9105487.1 acyl-CoA dehydrogenase family protein [Anaerolineales bacterium]